MPQRKQDNLTPTEIDFILSQLRPNFASATREISVQNSDGTLISTLTVPEDQAMFYESLLCRKYPTAKITIHRKYGEGLKTYNLRVYNRRSPGRLRSASAKSAMLPAAEQLRLSVKKTKVKMRLREGVRRSIRLHHLGKED